MIRKYQTKKDNLSHQVAKLISQIKKKDELGDDLKFIDFHQLQIENKKYLKEIEDKNGKLLKMKVSTGKIVKTWNVLKKSLNDQMDLKKELLTQIRDLKKQKSLKADESKKIEEKNSVLKNEKGKLEEQMKTINKEGTMNIQNFISDKKKESLLTSKIKNYERKIEIMSLKFKYALSQLGVAEKQTEKEIEDLAERIMRREDDAKKCLAKDEKDLIY